MMIIRNLRTIAIVIIVELLVHLSLLKESVWFRLFVVDDWLQTSQDGINFTCCVEKVGIAMLWATFELLRWCNPHSRSVGWYLICLSCTVSVTDEWSCNWNHIIIIVHADITLDWAQLTVRSRQWLKLHCFITQLRACVIFFWDCVQTYLLFGRWYLVHRSRFMIGWQVW